MDAVTHLLDTQAVIWAFRILRSLNRRFLFPMSNDHRFRHLIDPSLRTTLPAQGRGQIGGEILGKLALGR